MWTKRELILQAFDELGLSASVYDLPPESLESARRRLDTMMASWAARGIKLGYPMPGDADGSDLDDASGLPDLALEAVYTSLAVLIAPSYGKMVSDTTKARAREALSALQVRAAMPPQMQMPGTMPAGAGNLGAQPFLVSPTDPLRDGTGNELNFE